MDIEQPACFYLGREYDLSRKALLERPVMYDARDLCTHGVVVGMTGSGKTGLCISLLEEAALDGIPSVIIDPKGDLTNLLLQFPNLDPKDFQPWLNAEDARTKGLSLEEYARQTADKWREGLAQWGQTPERVARLRDSSEWRVYTPGSEAGLPLSILRTFAAPKGPVSREARNQKIDATTTALLGLAGIAADPVQSREHIFLAQLLLHSWEKGRDLDLLQLIKQVQNPPMSEIGAFDVETFYPEKERLKLAIALNNILASPSFQTWITGEPLDLGQLLAPKDKPRQLIFHLAHLDDAQRMFFVALLLEEVLSWTRRQSGTSSLRALLYFDEVFGYLPPHPGNPPSKVPLMTLLKQARAFGVGVLLATQNPVDLDYKALSNAGTWFVGKLQTERDKARLIEGLEGVAAERGTLSDRGYLENVISALGNRVFLLHNVHRPKPVLFQSRWALSYLRGPMSRDQIAELMKPFKEPAAGAAPAPAGPTSPPAAIPLCRHCHAELTPGAAACPSCGRPLPPPPRQADREFREALQHQATQAGPAAAPADRPALPADVRQFYVPVKRPAPAGAGLAYQPRVFGAAEVTFLDRKKGVEQRRPFLLLAAAPAAGQTVSWAGAEPLGAPPGEEPQAGASWAEVPEAVGTAKKLKALEKAFAEYLYGSAKLRLYENRKLGLVSEAQEDLLDFQARCRAAARAEADRALAAERAKLEPKFRKLSLPLPELLGGGAASGSAGGRSWGDWILGGVQVVLGGPKAILSEGRKQLKEQQKLEAEWRGKVASVGERWRQVGEDYGEVLLTPRKADVRVTAFGLAWAPFWRAAGGGGTSQVTPAYT